jgi:putative DNA primase/helicase
VRVLGLSKITEAPTNVTMLMTGNNLTLIGDLTRRALMTRLDAGCERPERREFTRDAIAHVRKFRADGIHAVLTISKAYQVAGCPRLKSTPYGSFDDWDRMIRRPLIWAGWPDPLQPAEGLREQDHEFVGMSDLLAAWLAVFGDRPVTASELYERINEREPAFGAEKTAYRHPALTDAAQIVMGDLRKWSVKELGYRLRQWAERIIDSRRIVKAGKSNAGVRWRVEQV